MIISRKQKKRIFDIIQIGSLGDGVSRGFDVLIMVSILINLALSLYETFDISRGQEAAIHYIEFVTILIFTGEYLLRVWTAEYLYPGKGKTRGALRYMFSFSGIVDLFSFLPFYLPVFFPGGAVAFRMFRVIRILRLFRINAYYDALNVIIEVVKRKKDQLFSSVFIILILMTAASLCMYSLEHEAQPEVFTNAFSGFWWAVSTLLTVGYGDIYPITIPGRIFGIIITFLGVGMVAIPTGILSAGFVEQYSRLKNLGETESELGLRFVRIYVEEGHPWSGLPVRSISLPPDLTLAVIQRGKKVLLPREDAEILPGDVLVLAAEGDAEDCHFSLNEMVLGEQHPWVGECIRNLDISRQTWLVMIRRDGAKIIPDGDMKLQAGDGILLYSSSRRGF